AVWARGVEAVGPPMGNRRCHGENPTFSHAFCAVRTGTAATLHYKSGERFRQVIESRQTVVHKTAIDQLSVLINEIFKQRLTETENRRTLVLRMALQRVNHFSRIGQ